MRKSSPQGWPPKPVAFGSSLGSSLVLVSALSYPCRGRNNSRPFLDYTSCEVGPLI